MKRIIKTATTAPAETIKTADEFLALIGGATVRERRDGVTYVFTATKEQRTETTTTATAYIFKTSELATAVRIRLSSKQAPKAGTTAENVITVAPLAEYEATAVTAYNVKRDALREKQAKQQETADRLRKQLEDALGRISETERQMRDLLDTTPAENATASRESAIAKASIHFLTKTEKGRAACATTADRHGLRPAELLDLVKSKQAGDRIDATLRPAVATILRTARRAVAPID